MTDPIVVKHCPTCRGEDLAPVFRAEAVRHNSLARLDASERPEGVDLSFFKTFERPRWSVCKSCGLAFAGLRPSNDRVADWYLPLFKVAEERGYDTLPLPADYVAGKVETHDRLYEILSGAGLIPSGARLLHIRCATGGLLDLARRNQAADVWGLDYFASCATHANILLGEDRVAQMTEPEPRNPFAQKTFDVIVANHMVTHSHDPAALVGLFRDWLAEDGVLVVYNEPDHALTLKSRSAYPRGLNFFHKQLFTEATFIAAMRAWGFEPSRVNVEGPDARKFQKNMMFACRKSAPVAPPKGDWRGIAGALRGWSRMRRASELLGLAPAQRAA